MTVKKDIHYYSEQDAEFDLARHKLDLFYPDNSKDDSSSIVVFIHGGTWISGSKDMYWPLGEHLASFGIMTAIINYRLGTQVTYQKMAQDCARAVKWVYDHASALGGNKHQITICGHSAGGHLGALIALSYDYFDALNMDNPIKKCLLIDAFGLNIGTMIRSYGAAFMDHIDRIFTQDPEMWKRASPINFVTNRTIPFMILVGGKSYPMLLDDNERFRKRLQKVNNEVYYESVAGKSHMEMITQLSRRENMLYKKIVPFIKEYQSEAIDGQ